MSAQPTPMLSGVVVHWRDEEALRALVGAWPADPRFELVVVDNGSDPSSPPIPMDGVRCLKPAANLGFGGGANAGIAAALAPIVLVLNPDAMPEPGALDELLRGFAALPDAAGLVPRLAGPDGEPQWRWQLRRLPSPGALLLQALFVTKAGLCAEPPAGTVIEQPAAAALALRRPALATLGGVDGFDAGFYPAWFEDIDLARRLAAAGAVLRYWPAARFRHRLGSTVPRLGYGAFLWIYDRNLVRYLRKHHGRAWAGAGRAAVTLGLVLRLLFLPLRRPRRAPTRAAAARGLFVALAGALTRWRRPARLAADYRAP
ncbi:MAG TPA: glycosyltransferase [Thermoanaerobaculia bacterium]|nr:glycosyltransferase [Thermoanaerobaculia bacterium]